MLIVVNYHYVRPVFDAPFSGIHGITPAELEAQLRLLGRAGEFIGAAQLRAAVRGTGALPDRAILVTFDDGLREQVEHALPVLERVGVPALFFVNTSPIAQGTVSAVHKIHMLRAHTPPGRLWDLLLHTAASVGVKVAVGDMDRAAREQYRYDTLADARLKYALNFRLAPEVRDGLISSCFRAAFGDEERASSERLYMSTAQLRELGARESLGTHGHEHVRFARLSRTAAARNVRTSIELLTQWTGVPPYALSYPYGSREACSRAASAGAIDAGIEFAFTMERAGNPDLESPLFLARFACNDVPGGRGAERPVETLFEHVAPAQCHRGPGEAHEPASARDTGDR